MTMFRYSLSCGLVGLVLLSSPRATAAPAADVPPGLTPMEPVRCMTDEDLEIHNRYISATGNGVEASGNCDIEIYDSYIEAGAIGVLADGNSDVELHNSHVEGQSAALLAQGNADISMRGSRIVGGTVVRGNAEIEDDGGNEISGRASTSPATSMPSGGVSIGPGGVRVGTGDESVAVGRGGVRVGTGDESVVVGGGGVRVQSGGQVTEVTGDWRGGGSVYTIEDTDRLLVELGATVEGGELHLQMAGDILFDFNSADIRPDSAAELAKVAHVIRQRSEGTVSVVGHTDSVGDKSYNMKLSEQRALAVMRWLNVREGIPSDLMRARGLGETQPVAYNTMPDGSDNPTGRAKNRRVELSFVTREAVVAAPSVQVSPGTGSVRVETRGPRTGTLPDSCARICRVWPALNELQATCVSTTLELGGYSVIGNYACIDVDTTAECVNCWLALQVSDAECAKIQRNCLSG